MLKASARALLVVVLLFAAAGWEGEPAFAVDWSQFHFSPSQRGTNPYETTLTPKTVGGLTKQWSARWYAPPDWFCDFCSGGYHQIPDTAPLQVGHLSISVFTFGGVRAYDSVTGALRWSRDDGEGCCDSGNNIAVANGIVYWPMGADDRST
jgi:hypothetical protein